MALDEAGALFERLKLRNDLGLLSEEYDVDARRRSATFRRASHIGLINTAFNLVKAHGPGATISACAGRRKEQRRADADDKQEEQR